MTKVYEEHRKTACDEQECETTTPFVSKKRGGGG